MASVLVTWTLVCAANELRARTLADSPTDVFFFHLSPSMLGLLYSEVRRRSRVPSSGTRHYATWLNLGRKWGNLDGKAE